MSRNRLRNPLRVDCNQHYKKGQSQEEMDGFEDLDDLARRASVEVVNVDNNSIDCWKFGPKQAHIAGTLRVGGVRVSGI
jgi:hypothetical protein